MPRLNAVVTNAKAVPKDWGFGQSSKKKTPYFWMEFLFTDITDEQNNKLEGFTIRKEFYMSDEAIDYTLRDLMTLGWVGKDIAELEKGQNNSFTFSKEVSLTTEIESYTNPETGKIYENCKVKFINDPNYAPSEKLEKPEFTALARKMKGKIAAYRSVNTPF